ncbi:hypothetical protein INT47_010320 [Mucor saturninus]|uniref:Uncharacterized protein n=1 Tax=Mucor saturninus TaxID=64648 RepID=A0A8H7QW74_9FUNG|nr:hypothetical protein INT47_010320 [Mucor saturninus]
MFKISSKSFTQQRAALKPLKNACIFEEEEEDQEDDGEVLDDHSSCYSLSTGVAAVTTHDSRHETMMLAQFFSTTGPEEPIPPLLKGDSKPQHQFKRASRLLSRLRKKPTLSALHTTTEVTPPKRTHIPLPDYHPDTAQSIVEEPVYRETYKKSTTTSNHLRDSGVYSETASERDSTYHPSYVPPVPTPPPPPSALASAAAISAPFLSSNAQKKGAFLTDLQQFPQPPFYKSFPQRPPPLPPAIASAAIASASANACSPTITACSPNSISSPTSTSTGIHHVPEAALKRRSVARLRHVQVQTEVEEINETRRACPHCRQSIGKDHRMRRPSCPPALSSTVSVSREEEETIDTKALMAMVVKLKSQLAEEQQCRMKLENQMSKRDELAKEKDKWAGDCLWLNDRIALLPE